MKALYVDNFRGFKDTFIEFKNINFFVGENSTGKTSILGLYNLLENNPPFNISLDFNTNDFSFGGYDEITCDESFSIGICNLESDVKDADYSLNAYYQFTNKAGFPVISTIAIQLSKFLLIFRKKADKWEYCYSKDKQRKGTVKETYYELINKIKDNNLGWNDIDKDIGLGESYALQKLSFKILRSQLREKNIFGAIEEILVRALNFNRSKTLWYAPIRSKPKKHYDGLYREMAFNSEGQHTPYRLRNYLKDKVDTKSKQIKNSIINFGKDSGLFTKLDIKLHGRMESSPFDLMVFLENKTVARIDNVGYGLSQVLPLLVDLISAEKGCTYLIQQPEVHLHPKAQASLGSLIFNMANDEHKDFLIETHSDFTIDRVRLCHSKNTDARIKTQVLYFERTKSGNTVTPILIDRGGNYSANQPDTFRNFFLKEQFDLLGM